MGQIESSLAHVTDFYILKTYYMLKQRTEVVSLEGTFIEIFSRVQRA